jgi:histidyl-tRNA synthetase
MSEQAKTTVKPQTLRGFCDYLPSEMIRRNRIIEKIRRVYERYGFVPIDTPVLEYLATLIGTGGEAINKEIFRLESPEREPVGMRFDLTVPFARVLAQYLEQIKLPFRRYHIGPVFRADKPGPGRYRQFTQFDIDAAGSESVIVDAEIISAMCDVMRELGLKCREQDPTGKGEYQVNVNNRHLMDALLNSCNIQDEQRRKHVLRVIDKMQKIGIDNMKEELAEGRVDESGDPIPGAGLDSGTIDKIVEFISIAGVNRKDVIQRLESVLPSNEITDGALAEMRTLAEALDSLCIMQSEAVFVPSLARGLDYYTGPVFEAVLLNAPEVGSVMGGGRYDKLVDRFLEDTPIPATGASIGLDRLLTGLASAGVLEQEQSTTQAMVIIMKGVSYSDQLKVARELRDNDIATEVYLGKPEATVSEQLSYANDHAIPVAIILGPDEVTNHTVSLKDLVIGKKGREGVSDREEYRKRGRTGQITVERGKMVETVRELLAGYQK